MQTDFASKIFLNNQPQVEAASKRRGYLVGACAAGAVAVAEALGFDTRPVQILIDTLGYAGPVLPAAIAGGLGYYFGGRSVLRKE